MPINQVLQIGGRNEVVARIPFLEHCQVAFQPCIEIIRYFDVPLIQNLNGTG